MLLNSFGVTCCEIKGTWLDGQLMLVDTRIPTVVRARPNILPLPPFMVLHVGLHIQKVVRGRANTLPPPSLLYVDPHATHLILKLTLLPFNLYSRYHLLYMWTHM